MGFWAASNLARITDGRWLRPAAKPLTWRGVSIDSRRICRGQAFAAVRGERFDGHDFVDDAVANGAAWLIVERPTGRSGMDAATLLVGDTVDALNRIAAAFRRELRDAGTRVISVSGSNGKTTTRHLIHAVLSAHNRGTQSPGNFNNRIGVPLTLLAASVDDDFVVVEIGTGQPGEVAALADVVRPDAAVITSIGREHLEYFVTVEAVAKEEASVLRYLNRSGLVVMPASGPGAGHLDAAVPPGASAVRVGRDVRCAHASSHRIGTATRITLADGLCFDLSLPGAHNAHNAVSAVAVGRWMQVDDAAIAGALGHVSGPPMRSQVVHFGSDDSGVTVINDAYNANPDSVDAALRMIDDDRSAQRNGDCVVVLGDMLEMGDAGPAAHAAAAAALAGLTSNLRTVVLVGPLSVGAADVLRQMRPNVTVQTWSQWNDELPERVAALLRPTDLVLIKASRSIGLERLVPSIEQRFGATACSTTQ